MSTSTTVQTACDIIHSRRSPALSTPRAEYDFVRLIDAGRWAGAHSSIWQVSVVNKFKISIKIMLKMLLLLPCLVFVALAKDAGNQPAPCSSDQYSLLGKCGGSDEGFLRCPKGYYCSQYGYCGTTAEYRENALCPRETRNDPDTIQYGFAPTDQVSDYMPQDDTEAEAFDSENTASRRRHCRTEKFHRFGKCGFAQHGHFRCKYGEWCNKWGYCSKFEGAAEDAFCPKEIRPNPDTINYVPTPDDDPDFQSQ